MTITNNGPDNANNATVYDFLPSGVNYVSAIASQGVGAYLNQTLVTDDLGTIAPGASVTLTILVTPTGAGPITNTANVTTDQLDPDSSNNSTSLVTTVISPAQSINLVLSQSVASQTGMVGRYEIFTMTVTNSGPYAATNATLIDALPANASLANAVPSQGGYASLANGIITDNFGTIAPGASATLIVILLPNSPGVDVNYAGVYSPDIPLAPASFAFGAVSVLSGPSVVGVAGLGSNALVISFDEAITPASATNKANDSLVSLGKPEKCAHKTLTITSAKYNSTTRQVTIALSGPLDPSQSYELSVMGDTPGGITDLSGRRLVNPQFSPPGANYRTSFLAGLLPRI